MKLLNTRNALKVNEEGRVEKHSHNLLITYHSKVLWWAANISSIVVFILSWGRIDIDTINVRDKRAKEAQAIFYKTELHMKMRESIQFAVALCREGLDRATSRIEVEDYLDAERRLVDVLKFHRLNPEANEECEVVEIDGDLCCQGLELGRCNNTFESYYRRSKRYENVH